MLKIRTICLYYGYKVASWLLAIQGIFYTARRKLVQSSLSSDASQLSAVHYMQISLRWLSHCLLGVWPDIMRGVGALGCVWDEAL